MLQNLNKHVCVSRHPGNNQDQWACYEPINVKANKKRPVWKNLTGLLSTAEMQRHLDKNYQSTEISKRFIKLSA